MDTKDIYQAELRRLVRNLGMKYTNSNDKAKNQHDPFSLFHFGQAVAYEEAIEMVKKAFHEEMKIDDWE